jgi:hypothetical protein
MPLFVCTKCSEPQGCSITNHSKGEILPIYCTPDEEGHIRVPEWRQVPIRVSPKHQSDIYNDPQGEPYKGLNTFIQTPMTGPIKPHNPEELRKLKEERDHRFKLRTEK